VCWQPDQQALEGAYSWIWTKKKTSWKFEVVKIFVMVWKGLKRCHRASSVETSFNPDHDHESALIACDDGL
jgi:hypothetical protein